MITDDLSADVHNLENGIDNVTYYLETVATELERRATDALDRYVTAYSDMDADADPTCWMVDFCARADMFLEFAKTIGYEYDPELEDRYDGVAAEVSNLLFT